MGLSGCAGRLALAALCLAAPCCGKRPEPPPAAPAGTIVELAGSSVTTDVNARAPAFARTDAAGALVRTQDAIGRKVLLLDFWSVFCQSCLHEMAFLRRLHEAYAPEGLEIVGVNTDFFPKERVLKFLEKTGLQLPYRLILDRDQSLSRLFSVEALPVLVLIDSDGWIRMVHLGYRPEDEAEIEGRVRKACGRIAETIVTLQPVGGTTAFSPPEAAHGLVAPGTPVADFSGTDAQGATVSFAAWRGNAPSVVFFWSLFCQPCRQEFERLTRLARQPPVPGLKVLAVNVDSVKLRAAAARALASRGEGIAGLFDREGEGGRHEIAALFGVSATPSTFLVGPEGTVRAAWSGELDEQTLTQAISQQFAAAAPAGDRR